MSDVGQRLIAEVKRVAGEHPEFCYRTPGDTTQCKYVKDSAPSCLVGHGLWNLGLIDASLERAVRHGYKVNSSGIHGLIDAPDLDLDDYEIEWLAEAQDAQDDGHPWGECVS